MTINHLANFYVDDIVIDSSICVVGGGISGLLLARRLASTGRRIVVVESGDESPGDEINELNGTDSSSVYTRSMNGRHRGLGGTSSRWGGRMIPISPHDTEFRGHLSSPAWPFDVAALGRYDEEIENIFRVAHGSYEDIPTETSESTRQFATGEHSFTPRWAKCPSFKRCNVARLFASDLRKMKNVEVWLDATVTNFDLERESGRVTGIVARNLAGRSLRVRAEQFILAAGTIETTRLLLILDAASGDNAFRGCDALGHYFQDHLKAEVATINRRNAVLSNKLFAYRYVGGSRRDLHLELGAEVQRSEKVASAFAYVAMDLAASPLADIKEITRGVQRGDLNMRQVMSASRNATLLAKAAYWRFVHGQLYVPPTVNFGVMACVEQRPHWGNRIRLSQVRDRLGVSKASLDWRPMDEDERTFRTVVRQLAVYWSRAGFDQTCPLEWTSGTGDETISIAARSEACAHPSGSTRMGADPATSVVGPDLRCHAVPNVAVASASVFPTAGSANPTLSIMKLAMWLGDSYPQPFRSREGHAVASSPVRA